MGSCIVFAQAGSNCDLSDLSLLSSQGDYRHEPPTSANSTAAILNGYTEIIKMCVCVREREGWRGRKAGKERERERERERGRETFTHLCQSQH
jgi:hypothetical protein